jgi:undecaprenyl-diphosphatase
VNTVIVLVAQDLIYLLVVVAAVVWLTSSRAVKVTLAAQAVVGLVLVGLGILLAGHVHSDPRPFMHDPASQPLFAHASGNGFPSDHSSAAGLLTALVFGRRRLVGAAVGVGAVAVGWARVAAHVHHAQDVVAGLLVGAAAGAVAMWLVARLLDRAERAGLTLETRGLTTADRG